MSGNQKRKNLSQDESRSKKSKSTDDSSQNKENSQSCRALRNSNRNSHNSQGVNEITNSNTSIESIPNNQGLPTDSQLAAYNVQTDSPESYETIANRLVENAINGIFEKKKIRIGDSEKMYTPVLNFFDIRTEYDVKPKFIQPTCILCKKSPKVEFGKVSNLLHHLKSNLNEHGKFRTWHNLYRESTAADDGIYLNKNISKNFIFN
jgi:hypothetical protein